MDVRGNSCPGEQLEYIMLAFFFGVLVAFYDLIKSFLERNRFERDDDVN